MKSSWCHLCSVIHHYLGAINLMEHPAFRFLLIISGCLEKAERQNGTCTKKKREQERKGGERTGGEKSDRRKDILRMCKCASFVNVKKKNSILYFYFITNAKQCCKWMVWDICLKAVMFDTSSWWRVGREDRYCPFTKYETTARSQLA